MRDTERVLLCTVVVLMIASLGASGATADPTDLRWGIQVGERFAYRYHGINNHSNLVNESWITESIILDEKIYVEIEDISGTPYPLNSGTPIATPYWANGTPLSDNTDLFFALNFGLLGPFALKLGNWTFIEEFTLDAIDDSFHEIYHNQVGWFNETSSMWNFTLVNYHYWNSSLITPYITHIKQYSKSNGLLQYERIEIDQSPHQLIILELTLIQSSAEGEI